MSFAGDDDLVYNPFSEDTTQTSPSRPTNGFYASAFFPTPHSPSGPELRRRRLSSTDGAGDGADRAKRRQHRSPMDIDVVPHSTAIHPLKSALAGKYAGLFNDADATRPGLTRALSEAGFLEGPDDDDSDIRTPRPQQVKSVIMHQVLPTDSLAGVSLKYGITLANLRRANQLWPNDTIHRREVLYIPLDQATRAKEYMETFPQDSASSDSASSSLYSATSTSSHGAGEITETFPPTSPAANVATIRKIPANQLSFFPPSSSRNTSRPVVRSVSTAPSPTQPRYTGAPTNSSLSSLLTVLPIGASTRDELITRLSLDSDRSGTNSPEEAGHELNEVPRRSRRNGQRNGHAADDDDDSMDAVTPKIPQRFSPPRISSRHTPLNGSQATSSTTDSTRGTPAYGFSPASPPRFYVSQPTTASDIRTAQLEPSPVMHLPSRSNTLTRTAGKNLLAANGPVPRTPSNGFGSGIENELGILGPKV